MVDQIMPPTQASLAASTATVRCDCRWHGRTNALVEPNELPADVPSVAWSVGRIQAGNLPITRRMLGVELDGTRQIWPAQVGWPVGPDGFRRIVWMIKRMINGHPTESMPRQVRGSRTHR